MKKIFLISLIVLLIISCKKNITNSSDIGIIMPLAIGNSWIYEDDDGDLSEVNITSEIDIDGITWYIDNNDNFYRNNSEGLWIYDLEDDREGLHLKYPIDIDESFINAWGWRFTCISKDFTFVNYVGCYEYYYTESYSAFAQEIRLYYKPNIGMVGQIFKHIGGDFSITSTTTLQSYSTI